MNALASTQALYRALFRLCAILRPVSGRGRRPSFIDAAWLVAKKGGPLVVEVNNHDGLRGEVPIEGAYVMTKGLAGLPPRLLMRLIKALPGDVEITTADDGTVSLGVDGFTFSLEGKSKDWYVPQPFGGPPEVEAPIADLRAAIRRVATCVSQDDTMEALGCLYAHSPGGEVVNVCGLNGHQFALMELALPDLARALGERGMLLSFGHLKVLSAWLTGQTARVSVGEREVRFVTDAGSVVLPNCRHQFPDYKTFGDVAARGGRTMSVDRAPFQAALSRLALCSTDNDRCVYLEEEPGHVRLSCGRNGNMGRAEARLQAVWTGSGGRMAFPVGDLRMLGHFAGWSVIFRMSGEEGPCQITGGSGDEGYKTIIMPMKVVETAFEEKAA